MSSTPPTEQGPPWVEVSPGRWEVQSSELGTAYVAFTGAQYIYGFDQAVYGHEATEDAAKEALESVAAARYEKRQAARRKLQDQS